MTKKLLTGLFAFLFCLPMFVKAQQCGLTDATELQMLKERLIANKEAFANGAIFNRDETVYVPIKYHIIGNNAGDGYAKQESVMDMQCRLNEEYLEHDIQFFTKGDYNYINSTNAYEDPGDNSSVLSFHKGQFGGGAINVFIAKNATTDGGLDEGITLGYYSPGFDWIVMRKNQVGYGSNTMPHEMGHFFSLMHTFYGWECNYFHNPDLGLGNGVCAGVTAPCFNHPNEFADGSNCNTAGDLLCDTPADYNLGFSNGNQCNYNGDACDANGDQLVPQANNWMSYFEGCDFEFTDMQVEMIHTDYNSPQRTYIRTSTSPTTNMVEGATTLLSPSNGAVTPNYNYVGLDWAHVPGATNYLVEIDILPTFSIDVKRYVVSVDQWGTFDLDPNTAYSWRVRPYNAYSQCADWSATGTFTTGATTTNVADVSEVADWQVLPNPAAQGQSVTLEVTAGQNFSGNVQVLNIAGQSISAMHTSFSTGTNQVQISTSEMAAGVYFVSIQTAQGVTTKRLVIN